MLVGHCLEHRDHTLLVSGLISMFYSFVQELAWSIVISNVGRKDCTEHESRDFWLSGRT
ncbi:hypothetical protein BDW71DRAFT_187625 [Aspergillus fruticulosus]